MMKRFRILLYVLVALVVLSQQSCISRLRRPEITGVIVDYDKKPIANCKVGDALTDNNGKFSLPEERYSAFFLTEMFAMEAPPVMVFEPIEKKGFEKDAIYLFHKWGGGQGKGAKTNIDTIFLKRIDQVFDISALLKNSDWKLGFTKHADTLYLVKNGFNEWCKTDRCSPFYSKYEALTDNYYTGAKNLPEGMIRRLIDVKFNDNQKFKMQVAQQYLSTFDGPDRKPDTLNTTGNFKLIDKNKMELNIKQMEKISGVFEMSEIDLYQIRLIKNP